MNNPQQTTSPEKVESLERIVNAFPAKDFVIYFFIRPEIWPATISPILSCFRQAKLLNSIGYTAKILAVDTAKNIVPHWIDDEYKDVEIVGMNQAVALRPQDFIVIWETDMPIVEDLRRKNVGSKFILQVHNHELVLDPLGAGVRLQQLGFDSVIVPNETVKGYLESLFSSHHLHIKVVTPGFPEYFKTGGLARVPTVVVSTRNQRSFAKLVKTFYLRNPHLSFVDFVDLRNIKREEYAEILGKALCGVWIDAESSHGSFPFECLKAETPLVALVPTLGCEHTRAVAEGKIAQWVQREVEIPDTVAKVVSAFVECRDFGPFTSKGEEFASQFTVEREIKELDEAYSLFVTGRTAYFTTLLNRHRDALLTL